MNQTIHYFLNVPAIQSATQGQNGPIVVTLFNSSSSQNEILEKNTINATNLEGPMKGKTKPIPVLIAAIRNGSTYVMFIPNKIPKVK